MASFTNRLSGPVFKLERPVVDMTGIDGKRGSGWRRAKWSWGFRWWILRIESPWEIRQAGRPVYTDSGVISSTSEIRVNGMRARWLASSTAALLDASK